MISLSDAPEAAGGGIAYALNIINVNKAKVMEVMLNA
jgi:hypothetical protein